jgi:hypothetical protein
VDPPHRPRGRPGRGRDGRALGCGLAQGRPTGLRFRLDPGGDVDRCRVEGAGRRGEAAEASLPRDTMRVWRPHLPHRPPGCAPS